MAPSCPFCDLETLREKLILETEDYLWFPTLGQIVEGYTLLVPKAHVTCLGCLDEEKMGSFTEQLLLARETTEKEYVEPTVTFEHGGVGQTVTHAHLHIVPTNVSLFSRIQKDYGYVAQIASLSQLNALFQLHGPYLFYGDCSGMYTFLPFYHEESHEKGRIYRLNESEASPSPEKTKVVPPQYLRIILAEAVGKPERANWRTMDPSLDKELLTRTRDRLRTRLNTP